MPAAQFTNRRTVWAGGVALGIVVASATAAPVQAQDRQNQARSASAHHRQRPAPTAVNAEHYEKALGAIAGLTQEVSALHAQLANLQERLDTQASEQAKASAALERQVSRQQDARTEVAAARAATIETLPPQAAPMTGADQMGGVGFDYRSLKVSPTGFLELANIYRSHALGNDLFSNFGSIPFTSNRPGREAEDRLTARSSRLGLIAQGDLGPTTHVAAVFEMDFLGAAQTANSVEANSFNPRARQLYGTLDLDDSGWHILAGQTWSLATSNGQGITPRNETIPQTIDAQIVPGFVWTRQPQIRVTKSFGKSLWLAVSLENPQTTFTGAVPADVIDQIANGAGLYGGAVNASPPVAGGGGAATFPTAATSSLNHLPDLVAKGAYEAKIEGRSVHLEVFGLGRAFTDRVVSDSNTVYAGGVGAGVVANLLPGLLDIEASTLVGKGIGRYGTSLLPDVTFDPSGKIEPIDQVDWLVGATLHPTPRLDVYAYAGEERQQRRSYNATFGLGSPLLNLSGCLVEGGSCAAATKSVAQGTIGAWRKIYEGPLGHAQIGLQYSYTERRAFSGAGGLTPSASDNMVLTSFRYYPF